MNIEVSLYRACGIYREIGSSRYLEVLKFTHFAKKFNFGKYDNNYKEKHLVDRISVSAAEQFDIK